MKIEVTDLPALKQKALQWASGFDISCCLDSNNFKDACSKFDLLLAVGINDSITGSCGSAFDVLEKFHTEHPGWKFGFLTYDLKNEIEELTSDNFDGLQFPDLYFFVPQHLILVKNTKVEIISANPDQVWNEISAQEISEFSNQHQIELYSRFSKPDYIETVDQIKQHISRGDIYVTNFCQEFFAENTRIDPLAIFQKLNSISPNPFASFFKLKDKYILCASPERFLAKRASKLISQPIKGTAPRYEDEKKDQLSKQTLKQHTKELQENVMIVDLVRNDLTKSAKQGTVITDELFGIYSFKQVHQMISTISCEIAPGITPVEAIKNTFPMGSMTGAPKISAMRLMEQYERSKRGIYSGTIGYFSPDGDFDFNVVIRTLLYDQASGYLSFQAGSAITYHADAEKEYEECLLKAKAIFEVLGQPGSFQIPAQ